MPDLLEMLGRQILPLVRGGGTRVVAPTPSTRRDSALIEREHFIEAYLAEKHTYSEAMWLLSGQAHLVINGLLYTLQAGDLCFLPPLFSHTDVYNRETPAYESMWFAYEPSTVGASYFRYSPFGRTEVVPWFRVYGWPEIAATFSALHREAANSDGHSADAIHGLLLQLVVLVQRALEKSDGGVGLPPSRGRVAPLIRRYLDDHYRDDIKLAAVAALVGLTPNHTAMVFKRETGNTIFEALTEIRIEHAARLLVEGAMPVKSVAEACGFRSVDHFTRTFRRLKAIVPSRYGKTESL